MKFGTAALDKRIFGDFIGDPSFLAARTIGQVIFGEAEDLSDEARALIRQLSGGIDPLPEGYQEALVLGGRRSSKSLTAACLGVYAATIGATVFRIKDHVKKGETVVVAVMAVDRNQASVIMNYAKAILAQPLFRDVVVRETTDSLVLKMKNAPPIELMILTSDPKRVRGRTIICGILDEACHLLDDADRPRAQELLDALRPGMATIPSARLIMISSPYKPDGSIYQIWKDFFGKPGADVLVLQGPTKLFNPTIPEKIIARAYERDPNAAGSEWGGQWREAVEAIFRREIMERSVERGVFSRPPIPGIQYKATCDPSGGSADGYVVVISHRNPDGRIVIDNVDEVTPPFDPLVVTERFYSDLVSVYPGISTIFGDRYAGQWPRAQWGKFGVQYEVHKPSTSDLYNHAIGYFNSGQVVLLDDEKSISQFCSLERSLTSQKPKIDHARFHHDDRAAAIAGAIYQWTRGDLIRNDHSDTTGGFSFLDGNEWHDFNSTPDASVSEIDWDELDRKSRRGSDLL